MSETVRVNKIWLATVLAVVTIVIIVLLTMIPDGSGTYQVKHTGDVTFHFGGWYSIDGIKVASKTNTIIPAPQDISSGLLWETGELVVTVRMHGNGEDFTASTSLGVINDPVFDTSLDWRVTFSKIPEGQYSVLYTLTEDNTEKAKRTVSMYIGGETE